MSQSAAIILGCLRFCAHSSSNHQVQPPLTGLGAWDWLCHAYNLLVMQCNTPSTGQAASLQKLLECAAPPRTLLSESQQRRSRKR
jgi:hypothetical protein